MFEIKVLDEDPDVEVTVTTTVTKTFKKSELVQQVNDCNFGQFLAEKFVGYDGGYEVYLEADKKLGTGHGR